MAINRYLFEQMNKQKLTKNRLTEEFVDRDAARSFWDKAKEGIIDIDNFHKAYDSFFSPKVLNLFDMDYEGLLDQRSSWGIIKDLDREQESTKALIKLWEMQFSNDETKRGKTQSQIDYEATQAAEEERRKKWQEEHAEEIAQKRLALQKEREEREKRHAAYEKREERKKQKEEEARVNAWNKIIEEIPAVNNEFRKLLDMDTISKVLEIAPKPNNYIIPEYKLKNEGNSTERTVYQYTINQAFVGKTKRNLESDPYYYSPYKLNSSNPNAKENEWTARKINEFYKKELERLELLNKYNKAPIADLLRELSYEGRKGELMGYYQDSKGTIIGLAPAANDTELIDSINTFFKYNNHDNLTDIPEDLTLVAIKKYDHDHNHNGRRDSYSWSWLSVSNKANIASLQKWVGDLSGKPWSGSRSDSDGWKEVKKEWAIQDPQYYVIDGMDKWYKETIRTLATE